MPANSPEQATQLLAEAFRLGDVEAALALYEPDATFFTGAGESVTGAAALREAFARGSFFMHPSPQRLEQELELLMDADAAPDYYRGLGYRVYLAYRLDRAGSRAWIDERPDDGRPFLTAGHEQALREHTLRRSR